MYNDKLRKKNAKELRKAWKEFLKKQEVKHDGKHRRIAK